jgi:predicted TIM-barrel fold metal-dependent hydrolase
MIFDGHVTVCFRDSVLDRAHVLRGDELVRLLDGPHATAQGPITIDRALVVVGGPGADGDDDLLVEAVHASDGRLVGCVTVNPLADRDTEIGRIRAHVDDHGFRAVKLDPLRHGYLAHRIGEAIGPIMEEAAGLDVPVLVNVGEPPFGFPSLFAATAEAHPRTTLMFCNFGTRSVSYALEAIHVARTHANVMLQTSHAQLRPLHEAVRAIGPERLVFASDLPDGVPASELAIVEALVQPPPLGVGLTSSELDLIMQANSARSFRC